MSGEPLPGHGEEPLEQLCVRAVETAAHDLGLEPHAFAEELAQGEIGMLIDYLRQAAPDVPDFALRQRIELLLHRLTTWTRLPEGGSDPPD